MSFVISLLFKLLLVPAVFAANDWSTPCISGSCTYETGDGVTTPWSSLILDGGHIAISDITEAAGWHVLDCDATSDEAQEIRMVCINKIAGCDHLFQGGAENTIIRLPEFCSSGPFARVTRTWIHKDQSLPDTIAQKVKRQRSEFLQVRGLAFDFDFTSIPPSRGEVSFSLTATNNPNQRPSLDSLKRSLHSTIRHGQRSFPGKESLQGFIESGKKHPLTTNKEISFDLLNIQQNLSILKAAVNCPAQGNTSAHIADIDVNVDVDAKAHIVFGVALVGSIVPPKASVLAVTAVFSGYSKATFNIKAKAQGLFDTGKITLLSQALPGFSVPGIFTLGPSLSVTAQAKAQMDLVADIKVTTAWDMPNVGLIFPPSAGTPVTTVKGADTPIALALAPGSRNSTGTIEAHLIPRVDVGINVLTGLAKAVVFLDLDASSDMNLTMNASPSGINSTQSASPAGCIDVDSGIAITAGAEASLGTLFNNSTRFDLYKKQFNIYDKCFGTQKRDLLLHVPQLTTREQQLSCPVLLTQPIQIISDIIGAKN